MLTPTPVHGGRSRAAPSLALLVAVAIVAALVVPLARAAPAGGGFTGAGNRRLARRAAGALLAMVPLPSAAVGSPTEPAGDGHVLSAPSDDEATPNLVDAHAWWTVPGPAAAVIAYVRRHLPRGVSASSSGSGSAPPGFATASFSLAPVPGRLSERLFALTVVQVSPSTTAVRTDGETVWITPRPRWEQIPPTARTVTFTATGADSDGRAGPVSAPDRLTGSAARRVVAAINRMGIVQPGTRFCPAAVAVSVSLTVADAAGRTVARAVEHPTGCASVSLTIGSRIAPPLDDDPSITEELERVNAIRICPAAALVGSVTLPGPAGRQDEISFSFRNRSDRVCRLAGFPRLTLFAAGGHILPVRIIDQGASIVRGEGLGAAVPLDPGSTASFAATWLRCPVAPAARVTVAVPGVRHRFTFQVVSARRPLAPCGARLSVGNLSGVL